MYIININITYIGLYFANEIIRYKLYNINYKRINRLMHNLRSVYTSIF